MPLHLTAGNMSAKSVQNQNWAKVSVCSFKVRQGPKWDKFFSRQIVLSINIVPLTNSSSVPVLWIEGSPSILASAGSNISLKCRWFHDLSSTRMTSVTSKWQAWQVWTSMTSILASARSNISLKCRCLHKRWLLISDHWTIRNTEKGKFNWKKKYWDYNSQWLRTSLLYLASFHPFICTPCEDLAKENQILLNLGARAGKEGGQGGGVVIWAIPRRTMIFSPT